MGIKYVDEIRKTDVEEYRRWMRRQGYAEPTINKGHMLLTRLFNLLNEWKASGRVHGHDFSNYTLPSENPGSLVPKVNERPFARRVVISRERVTRLVSWAVQFGHHDLADAIEGLYESRLRQSDFYRLTDENIDFDHKLLQGVQHKTITTKNPSGVPFVVAMPATLAAIAKRRMARTKAGAPLFRRSGFQKQFERVRRAAGLPHVTLQDLRRSAATALLDAGVDAYTVAESLGHTTLRNLPAYTPRNLQHHRAASKLLEPSVEER